MMESIAGTLLTLSAIFYVIAKSSKDDSVGLLIGNGGLLAIFAITILACVGVFLYAIGLVVFVGYKSVFL